MQEQNNSQGARGVPFGIAAMAVVVTASNILVQYPINNWLTWGALSYPFAFLVTDLTNRRLGPGSARRVVWVGFAFAVVLSAWLATPRIAGASGSAFSGRPACRRVGVRPPAASEVVAAAVGVVVAGVDPGYGAVLLPGLCRNRPAVDHVGSGRPGGEGGVCGAVVDPVPAVAGLDPARGGVSSEPLNHLRRTGWMPI